MIRLRKIEPSDLPFLYQWENDASSWADGANHNPLSQQDLRNYIESTSGDIYRDGQLRLVIMEDETTLGCIDLFDFDPRNRRAAIGMYMRECDRQFEFGDLCWGIRSLYNAEKLVKQKNNLHLHFITIKSEVELEEAQKSIAKLIADNNIVNIVTGNMEFGPRALCHTSTLFLPTIENTHCNNEMNGRNEVMPCAPVCKSENAYKLFENTLDNVVGSDEFMICTHTYVKQYSRHYAGIMHKRPLEFAYTGRPQIVYEDNFIYGVLDYVEDYTDYKAIVNTSFNVHGRPIAFDTISILQNFEYQSEHAKCDKMPYLFIIKIEM